MSLIPGCEGLHKPFDLDCYCNGETTSDRTRTARFENLGCDIKFNRGLVDLYHIIIAEEVQDSKSRNELIQKSICLQTEKFEAHAGNTDCVVQAMRHLENDVALKRLYKLLWMRKPSVWLSMRCCITLRNNVMTFVRNWTCNSMLWAKTADLNARITYLPDLEIDLETVVEESALWCQLV